MKFYSLRDSDTNLCELVLTARLESRHSDIQDLIRLRIIKSQSASWHSLLLRYKSRSVPLVSQLSLTSTHRVGRKKNNHGSVSRLMPVIHKSRLYGPLRCSLGHRWAVSNDVFGPRSPADLRWTPGGPVAAAAVAAAAAAPGKRSRLTHRLAICTQLDLRGEPRESWTFVFQLLS